MHPDGGIWFTDPFYGIRGNYEGFKAEQETKEAVYRVDGKTCRSTRSPTRSGQPNGLCFSPDYKKLYVADTGMPREIKVWDVDGNGCATASVSSNSTSPGRARRRRPTAFAATRTATSGQARVLACRFSRRRGAHRHDPSAGNMRERLFRWSRRNRLFMTASQSLYAFTSRRPEHTSPSRSVKRRCGY